MTPIMAEIELTRNTLADVQALRMEVGMSDKLLPPNEPQVSEESLTSEQWLKVLPY